MVYSNFLGPFSITWGDLPGPNLWVKHPSNWVLNPLGVPEYQLPATAGYLILNPHLPSFPIHQLHLKIIDGLAYILVSGTDEDPDTDADRRELPQGLDENTEPVGKDLLDNAGA